MFGKVGELGAAAGFFCYPPRRSAPDVSCLKSGPMAVTTV